MKLHYSYNYWILLLLLIVPSLSQCTNISVRKEWRQLSSQEQENYLNAVKALKARPRSNTSDLAAWNFDQFSEAHFKFNSANHGTPLFFPWHRNFINYYERALRSIISSVTIPYWDWTLDSQRPSQSDVFASRFFGGNGDPITQCVMDGIAAGWQVSTNAKGCLKRCNQFSSFYGPEAVSDLLSRSDTFAEFQNYIENGPHGAVHNQIGGLCGDFSSMASTNDPVFYLHHAMIDKLWWRWQSGCSSNVNAFSSNTNVGLPPMPYRIADMLSTTSNTLCYTYSRSAGDVPLNLECPNGSVQMPGPNGELVDNRMDSKSTTLFSSSTTVSGTQATAGATRTGSFPVVSTTATRSSSTATPVISKTEIIREDEKNQQWLEISIQSLIPGMKDIAINPLKIQSKLAINQDIIIEPKIQLETANVGAPEDIIEPKINPSIEPSTVGMTMSIDHVKRPPLPIYRFNQNYTVKAPPCRNYTDAIHLRHPDPMPESFIKQMMLDEYYVRKVEVLVKLTTDRINNQRGYISPAALKYYNTHNLLNRWKPPSVTSSTIKYEIKK
ncbi:hypothetical protein BC833DRAFT_575830 [Globomyces pollinis-pini]|nr:hypothetical protein BC833DRAFT_575830 [Globomyces pollinis-pini]